MVKDILTGTNIRLRALEPGDVELLYQWENDTSVWSVSNTLAPFSKFQLEQYVLNSQNDLFAAKQLRLMAVIHPGQAEEIPVGTLDLFDFEPFHRRAGLGIMICEPYRGRGLAHEALGILINYAFGTLRLHQLYCNISSQNTFSLQLFEKLGFARCGARRDWIRDGGQWVDEWMFQLINPDE
jgi:diamine N-acetyltransferase